MIAPSMLTYFLIQIGDWMALKLKSHLFKLHMKEMKF